MDNDLREALKSTRKLRNLIGIMVCVFVFVIYLLQQQNDEINLLRGQLATETIERIKKDDVHDLLITNVKNKSKANEREIGQLLQERVKP